MTQSVIDQQTTFMEASCNIGLLSCLRLLRWKFVLGYAGHTLAQSQTDLLWLKTVSPTKETKSEPSFCIGEEV